jgi:hypothetical protein
VTSCIGEALDEIADGFPLHSPSVGTERICWQDRSKDRSPTGPVSARPRCVQRPGGWPQLSCWPPWAGALGVAGDELPDWAFIAFRCFPSSVHLATVAVS